MNILLDPFLLFVPKIEAKKEEVTTWVAVLKVWLEEIADSPHAWYHCAEAITRHLGYESLPSFKVLRDLQRKYQIEIEIAEIMLGVTNFFLQETFEIDRVLEDRLRELNAIIEPHPEKVSISPRQFAERWPEAIRPDMFSMLAIVGAGKWKGDFFSTNLSIATMPLPEANDEIKVAGKIAYLTENEEPHEETFIETLLLLNSPDHTHFRDIVQLWHRGERGIRQAIEDAFRRDWYPSRIEPLPFQLGSHFLASLDKQGLGTNRIVLSKIIYLAAAILADKAMHVNCDLHPLRESKAPGSPQRTRKQDGAKAWRVAITNKGVGWRMHYWRIPRSGGSHIEFANVLKKHDPEEIY